MLVLGSVNLDLRKWFVSFHSRAQESRKPPVIHPASPRQMVIYLSVILTVNQNLQILATRHRTDGYRWPRHTLWKKGSMESGGECFIGWYHLTLQWCFMMEDTVHLKSRLDVRVDVWFSHVGSVLSRFFMLGLPCFCHICEVFVATSHQ